MTKAAFAFQLGQRVNVPGRKDVQGIISLPTSDGDFGIGFNAARPKQHIYFLRWVGDNGERTEGWFGEADLTSANVPGIDPTIAKLFPDTIEFTDPRARSRRAPALAASRRRHPVSRSSGRGGPLPARKRKTKKRK